MWMMPGDIVLVGFRNFQSDKVDILHKYSFEHARELVRLDEIPEHFLTDATNILSRAVEENIFGENITTLEQWQEKLDSLKQKLKLYMQQEVIDMKKIKTAKQKIAAHMVKKKSLSNSISDSVSDSFIDNI